MMSRPEGKRFGLSMWFRQMLSLMETTNSLVFLLILFCETFWLFVDSFDQDMLMLLSLIYPMFAHTDTIQPASIFLMHSPLWPLFLFLQSTWRWRWRSTWYGCQRFVSSGPRRGRGWSGLGCWELAPPKERSSPSWTPTVRPMWTGCLRCWVRSKHIISFTLLNQRSHSSPVMDLIIQSWISLIMQSRGCQLVKSDSVEFYFLFLWNSDDTTQRLTLVASENISGTKPDLKTRV